MYTKTAKGRVEVVTGAVADLVGAKEKLKDVVSEIMAEDLSESAAQVEGRATIDKLFADLATEKSIGMNEKELRNRYRIMDLMSRPGVTSITPELFATAKEAATQQDLLSSGILQEQHRKQRDIHTVFNAMREREKLEHVLKHLLTHKVLHVLG